MPALINTEPEGDDCQHTGLEISKKHFFKRGRDGKLYLHTLVKTLQVRRVLSAYKQNLGVRRVLRKHHFFRLLPPTQHAPRGRIVPRIFYVVVFEESKQLPGDANSRTRVRLTYKDIYTISDLRR